MSVFIEIKHPLSRKDRNELRKKFCLFCNKFPEIKEILSEHISWHLKYKPIKCNTCNKLFESQRLFKKHNKKSMEENKVPCGQTYTSYENDWIEFIIDILTGISEIIGQNTIKRKMLERLRVYITNDIGGFLCDIFAGRPINENLVVHSTSNFLASGSPDSSLVLQQLKDARNLIDKILKEYETIVERRKGEFSSKDIPTVPVSSSKPNAVDIQEETVKVKDRSIVSEKKNSKSGDAVKSTPQEKSYSFIDVNYLDDLKFKALEDITDRCFMCDRNFHSGNLKIQHIIEKHMGLKGFQPFSCSLCTDGGKKDVLFASVDLFKNHFRIEHSDKDHKFSSLKDSNKLLDQFLVLSSEHYNFINKYNQMFVKCFKSKIKRKCPTDDRSDLKKSKITDTVDESKEDTSQVLDGTCTGLLEDILGDIKTKNPHGERLKTTEVTVKKKTSEFSKHEKSVGNVFNKGSLSTLKNNVNKSRILNNEVRNNSSGKECSKQPKSSVNLVKLDIFATKKEKKSSDLPLQDSQKKRPSEARLVSKGLNGRKDRKILDLPTPAKDETSKKKTFEQRENPFLRKNGTAYNGYSYYVEQCSNKCNNCIQPVIPKTKKVICCRSDPWYLNFRTPFWYLFSSNHINIILASSSTDMSCQLCSKEFAKNGCGIIKHVISEHLSLKKFLFKCRLCKLETNNITHIACHWKATHNSTGKSFSNNLIWRCPSIPIKYPDEYSIEVNKECASSIEDYVRKFVKCFPLLKTKTELPSQGK